MINTLLQSPLPISEEEIDTLEKKFDATFYNETHAYNLWYQNWSIWFSLAYKDILPDMLTEEEKTKFTAVHEQQDNWIVTYYLYETGATRNFFSYNTINFPTEYHVAPPRQTNADETKIPHFSIDDLVAFIQNKHVVFYTGAGISIASGVPHMQQFMYDMGINKTLIIDNFIRAILHKPWEITDTFAKFCTTLFENNPNKAHYIVRDLAQYKNTSIITENIDILHERSGILPYHTEWAIITKDIDPTQFIDIDAFICIWLRHDDRWLLAWYKLHNPSGKIISLDLQCPTYLGEEDYLVQWDLQEILIEVEKQLL